MSNEIYQKFKVLTQKIAEFKEKNNLTYQKIGDATGVNKSHVYRIVNMDTFPSLKFVIRLTKYMKLPLFSLFIPSEEMNRQEFANKINKRLKELDWTHEEFSKITAIPLLRLMNIMQSNSSPSIEERKTIIKVLDLKEETDYLEIKLNLLKTILSDLGLKDEQINNIMQYVKENKENID
ncbi:hypothetical protein BBF96_11830 [Anoxybacter fermentans]|uniref:HTH cro/C1-type domain-containing protein n=1 Tax=Anoxybacter fermentans TaxID=1323375 RepID=A0A3S9T0S8_9FIRM|nr:helix-turn-helix transcriptional regulator [Anoxybacter fermentans]AZR74022.1 hypothetical protein BBF96_11830 [Anoxybacter fermentans]